MKPEITPQQADIDRFVGLLDRALGKVGATNPSDRLRVYDGARRAFLRLEETAETDRKPFRKGHRIALEEAVRQIEARFTGAAIPPGVGKRETGKSNAAQSSPAPGRYHNEREHIAGPSALHPPDTVTLIDQDGLFTGAQNAPDNDAPPPEDASSAWRGRWLQGVAALIFVCVALLSILNLDQIERWLLESSGKVATLQPDVQSVTADPSQDRAASLSQPQAILRRDGRMDMVVGQVFQEDQTASIATVFSNLDIALRISPRTSTDREPGAWREFEMRFIERPSALLSIGLPKLELPDVRSAAQLALASVRLGRDRFVLGVDGQQLDAAMQGLSSVPGEQAGVGLLILPELIFEGGEAVELRIPLTGDQMDHIFEGVMQR